MKRILAVLAMVFLFISMSVATAAPLKNKEINVLDADGSFSGYIGVPRQQDPIIMGTISGEYQLRNRGGGFTGDWTIDYQNKSGAGTVRGFFGRRMLLGRLTIEGVNRTLPLIGFIKFNTENLTFIGRAMSFIGPALYFWGSYQPN